MIRLQTTDTLRKLLQRREPNVLGQPLQLHAHWLDKGANGDLPPRAAFVEAEVKHGSAGLAVDRRKKKKNQESLLFHRHQESRRSHRPVAVGPGVRAADELGDDGEHAGWTLVASASSQRLEQGGGNAEVGRTAREGHKGLVEVRGVE